MKKIIISLVFLLFSQTLIAQNTFPTTGGVGLGTTNPQHGYIHINAEGPSSGINLWTNTGSMTSRIWINSLDKLFHISRGDNPNKGITLDNDGNIGIGTTVFDSKFEIKHSGTIGAKWNSSFSYFKITNGTNSLIADPNEIYSSTDLAIGTSYNHPIYFRNVDKNGKTDLMTIKQDGKIGIGTINPEHGKIQINGNGPSEGITLWTNSGEYTSRIWINSASKNFHISRGDDPLKGITIDNDGNMSLGTLTNGSHKLAVEGSIGAREIKVEANEWSDFVFEKNYDLRTLEDVEEHINSKGHLPEIPSEKEVLENGINLGEMDSKLLQKIEELTLYLIDQNKKLKQQGEQIEQLIQDNHNLKKELSTLKNK
ncbi:hypothetical protein [Flammeovirga sp. SJP92]|uniref:hypothetical protein n=1 Tax=Flammeovirga sp. SJP92 TaxID=1775430 RepID=UPI000786E8D2|nr:hypothetical protein [Flammeovirga sp. SJP92]KXX66562.1 hypothetical protein AVL50_31590 [Flammeovirga sp. SJP92]